MEKVKMFDQTPEECLAMWARSHPRGYYRDGENYPDIDYLYKLAIELAEQNRQLSEKIARRDRLLDQWENWIEAFNCQCDPSVGLICDRCELLLNRMTSKSAEQGGRSGND